MSLAVGPDVWNNAPDGSSPVDEIQVWLGTMRTAALGWKAGIKANEAVWESKIDSLVTQIDGLSVAIGDDVFMSTTQRASYDVVCNIYQDLKDKLTLSRDFYLSTVQQKLNDASNPLGFAGGLVEQFFAQTQALLRQLFGGAGVIIGGAIVIILLYLYLTRRK